MIFQNQQVILRIIYKCKCDLHLYIILRMTCWLKYQYNLCFGIELFNIEEKVISLHQLSKCSSLKHSIILRISNQENGNFYFRLRKKLHNMCRYCLA